MDVPRIGAPNEGSSAMLDMRKRRKNQVEMARLNEILPKEKEKTDEKEFWKTEEYKDNPRRWLEAVVDKSHELDIAFFANEDFATVLLDLTLYNN